MRMNFRHLQRLAILTIGGLTIGFTTSCDPEPKPAPTPKPDAPTLDITYEGSVNNNLTIGDIPAAGGTYTVSIKSNRDWGYYEIDDNSGPDDNRTSCSVSPRTGSANTATTVTITVNPNSGGACSGTLEFRTVTPSSENTRLAMPASKQPVIRTVTLSQLAYVEPEPEPIVLETARVEYVFDRYENNTGSYWLAFQFQNENGTRSEINLDLISDFTADLLQAYPAVGTYEFSDAPNADKVKGTFSQNSEFIPNVSEYEFHSKLSGGTVKIQRDNNGKYAVDIKVTTGTGENAQKIFAKYEGPVYPIFFPEVAGNVSGLNTWDEVSVDKFKGNATMWQIDMKNANNNTMVRLTLNTAADLDILPAGNFPMGTSARAGVTGTAEPASMHNLDNYDWGCWYWGDYAAQKHITVNYPDVQYAVPGEGAVNITKEGNLYTISFTFTGPDGKTVSGSCQKEIEIVDPNAFSIPFTSANYSSWGSTNHSVNFYWDGAGNGEKLELDLFVPGDTIQLIPDGIYNFSDTDNVPMTFGDYGSLTIGISQDQKSVSPDGGTVKFTQTGDNYKVEFNIHYEDGRTLKCGYEGAIVAM